MIEAAIGSILDGPNANGYSTTPDRDAASAGSQTASQNPLSTLKPPVALADDPATVQTQQPDP